SQTWRACAMARSRKRSAWYHQIPMAAMENSGSHTSSTSRSSRGRTATDAAIMPAPAVERQIDQGDADYFTRSTRTLWLQPCTYISQLPRIIGLIVTSGLSTSGQEYVPDSACFQTWPLSRVNVVWP